MHVSGERLALGRLFLFLFFYFLFCGIWLVCLTVNGGLWWIRQGGVGSLCRGVMEKNIEGRIR